MQTIQEFTVSERYFIQWQHGAPTYYSTYELAVAALAEHQKGNPGMTEENKEYWIGQKYFMGKQVVITQRLEEHPALI